MTMLRLHQLDPEFWEPGAIVRLNDDYVWTAVQAGSLGAWHEDEADVGAGSTSVVFTMAPDPTPISIQVWLNGVLLRRDVDWDYSNPDPGDATLTVPDLSEGDYVVLRWQEA